MPTPSPIAAEHHVIREDERGEFEALRADLLAELDLKGAVETLTFDELLHAAWNLHRFRRLETGTAASLDDPLLGCYEARARHAWRRAVQELRTLQTNRALRILKLEDDSVSEVPVIADINELTKRSHSEVIAAAIHEAVNLKAFQGALRIDRPIRNRNGRAPRITSPEKLRKLKEA